MYNNHNLYYLYSYACLNTNKGESVLLQDEIETWGHFRVCFVAQLEELLLHQTHRNVNSKYLRFKGKKQLDPHIKYSLFCNTRIAATKQLAKNENKK